MADKRKRKQQEQADKNILNHLDSLGIQSVDAYQRWCAENGFSRRLNKSQADRRRERLAVQTRGSVKEIRSHRRSTLPHHETVKRILAGKIKEADVAQKGHRRLCAAVGRLNLLNPQHQQESLKSFRVLVDLTQKRKAKFHGGSHPETTENQFRSCSYVEALASIASFSHRWIRPLETWKTRTHNQRRQFLSLVSHLFEAHPTPSFFYSTWFNSDFEKGLKEQSSFVHVAAGHSICKANIPIVFTKRMSQHFLKAPADCDFNEALRWGQVMGLGGDPILARAALSSPLGRNFENNSFWQTVLEWFITHPMFDRNLFGVVYDYLHCQKFGAQETVARVELMPGHGQRTVVEQIARPNLSMKGRTPTALMRDVHRWHQRLQVIGHHRSAYKWPHSNIRELFLTEGEKENSIWTIRQLLSSEALDNEGRTMNHCVSSYASSCQQQNTSIWTVQHTQDRITKRALTVEVRLKDRVIVQVRGKSNRLPKPNEIKILHRWAQAADLIVGCC